MWFMWAEKLKSLKILSSTEELSLFRYKLTYDILDGGISFVAVGNDKAVKKIDHHNASIYFLF